MVIQPPTGDLIIATGLIEPGGLFELVYSGLENAQRTLRTVLAEVDPE
jgi:hypothetical protein